MSARDIRRRVLVAATGGAVAAALLLSGGAHADDPAALRGEADRLRSANAGLAEQAQEALLELYALEAQLGRAEQRLANLQSREAELERRQASAQRQLSLARRDLAVADRRLGSRLQALYVEGEVDPLAVLLGAESFDEAVAALDGLGRLAGQDRSIVEQVRKARDTLRSSLRELAARRAQVQALLAEAAAARAALEQARGERASYLAGLYGERALNERQIARLLDQAAAAESRSRELVAEGTGSPNPAPAPAPKSGARLTVSSTGYCLRGKTSTGVAVGWGVVAVDPAVIPLGTRMYVPGYGNGVAADTGSAVRGAMIDVWFPECSQALAWGRRVVTITLR